MSDAETPTPEQAAPEPELPLPPATFDYLVLSLRFQAEMQLGLIHFGDEKERPAPDLRTAQHTIDLLGVLQEKTKGNLAMEEHRLLENTLTELRFRYVQAAGESRKQA